jgi:hypothetical protein
MLVNPIVKANIKPKAPLPVAFFVFEINFFETNFAKVSMIENKG